MTRRLSKRGTAVALAIAGALFLQPAEVCGTDCIADTLRYAVYLVAGGDQPTEPAVYVVTAPSDPTVSDAYSCRAGDSVGCSQLLLASL